MVMKVGSKLNQVFMMLLCWMLCCQVRWLYDLKKAKDMFPNLPILMLTAKGELSDKMQGFNLGADEYITKPFYKEELLARLKRCCVTGVLGQDGALK